MKWPTDWEGANSAIFTTLAVGTQSSQFLVLPSALASRYTSPTLVRTLGTGYFVPSTCGGAAQLGMGIILWPGEGGEDTLPTGDENPRPIEDPELDWIWQKVIYFSGCDDFGLNIEIDSKAMRKIPAGHGILWVVEAATSASFTTGGSLAVSSRCLIKE